MSKYQAFLTVGETGYQMYFPSKYCPTREEALELARTLKRAMDDFAGREGNGTIRVVEIPND